MSKLESSSNDETRKRRPAVSAEQGARVFDLEERTARFGESVIAFAKKIPTSVVNSPLIGQLVRAATSVGANYGEAVDAESKSDYRHKIGICRKESRESKHWLRMIAAAEAGLCQEARTLYKEATELNLIFGSIRRGVERT